MPYFDAMAAFVPQGRAMARLLYGCPGVQVPGGIGPQVRSSSFRKLCRRVSGLTLLCVLRSGHGRGRGGGYGAEMAGPDGDRTSPDAVSVGHACRLANQNVPPSSLRCRCLSLSTGGTHATEAGLSESVTRSSPRLWSSGSAGKTDASNAPRAVLRSLVLNRRPQAACRPWSVVP